MQAYLDKRHRQQNKEILIRHSPGIGECFFVFKYSINQKIKKISLGAVKMTSQRFVLCKGIFGQENLKIFIQEPSIYVPSFLNIV